MNETREDGRRLYKARGPDGEVAWVDHDELWRLQQEQAERLRRERTRRRRLVLLALAGLVAVALVLVFSRLRMGVEPPEPDAAPRAEADAAVAPPGEAGSADASAEPEAAPADAVSGTEASARSPEVARSGAAAPAERAAEAVRAWAAAWASRDVDTYLASYSGAFAPADGSSRSSWESLRRDRLTTPAWIRVEIEGLGIAVGEDGRAEARFLQSYSSPDYADVVRKTLELVEVDGIWRITAERAETP